MEGGDPGDDQPPQRRALRVRAAAAAAAGTVAVLLSATVAAHAAAGRRPLGLRPRSKPRDFWEFPNCKSLMIHEGCKSKEAWSCEADGVLIDHSDGELEVKCCCDMGHFLPAPDVPPQNKTPEWAAFTPSLFCFALMMPPPSYETELMSVQASDESPMGIFGCDLWAVYSNVSVQLGPRRKTDILHGSLSARIGGKYKTALNTEVFIRLWDAVVKDPRAKQGKWAVKVDPDTVFLPHRLRQMMYERWASGDPQRAVYLNNCYLGLHGPIEVLSQQALQVYAEERDRCVFGDAGRNGQEDVYLKKCMKELEIEKVDAFNLLLEAEYACNERPSTPEARPPCFSQQVAFHPFKSVESYIRCNGQAMEARFGSGFYPVSDRPSKKNHHHA